VSAIQSIDGICQSSLYRGDEEQRFSFARDALLLDLHLLRSGAFVPARCQDETRLELGCPQSPPGRTKLSFDAPQGLLRVRDAVLLGAIQRRCWGEGLGVDPVFGLSLNEAAAMMGLAGRGGAQRQLASDALRRLWATTFAWQEAFDEEIVELHWRWIEALHIEPALDGPDTVWLRLSNVAVELLEEGYLHSLNRRICLALTGADQVAARLWMVLEAERFGEKPFYYSLFRCPQGAERERSNALFVAEIVGLDQRADRPAAARRLGKACQTIGELDPGRYHLELAHGKGTGMYTLAVRRFRRASTEARCA